MKTLTNIHTMKSLGIFLLLAIMLHIPIRCKKSDSEEIRISQIELYRLDVTKERHFSHGTWKNRQHVILKISAGNQMGWSEAIASKNTPDLDICKWGNFLEEIKGLTISEAFLYLKDSRNRKPWTKRELEFVEMALLDLSGRLQGKPAVELLGLTGKEPVYGTFCVLEEKPELAAKQAQLALEQNLKTHIKVKLFGKEELDRKLIKAVRKVVGPEAFVIADPNRGYKSWKNLDELARTLVNLYNSGIDACEDPSILSNEQWIILQQKVGDLALIPDSNLRPAWESVNTALPNMGEYYNFHPACMGNFFDMVKLGAKVKDWGHDVMIGDASLIGPACTAWQQIAIGLGASWVEALEKPQESETFLKCIVTKATYQQNDGRFAMKLKPGFGLEVDEKLLKEKAVAYCLFTR